jgi:FkbM family methyltransferase
MTEGVLASFTTRHGPMLAFRGDAFIAACFARYGEYSRDEFELLAQIAKPGMTIVEVGANIGAFTVPLARKCAPGVFYAFEPQQLVFQALCANLANNGIENVIATAEACGDQLGHAVVPPVDYAASRNPGGVSLVEDGSPGRRVAVITLDSLAIPHCGLLKIDAEGFEPKVIRGATELNRRCRPALYVENDRLHQEKELIELIAGLGYRLYWHFPSIAGDDELFGKRLTSRNMLCIPVERGTQVHGLPLVEVEQTGAKSLSGSDGNI